jgi:hypothetical protein
MILAAIGVGVQAIATIGSMATGIIAAKEEYKATMAELESQRIAVGRERQDQIAEYQYEVQQRIGKYEQNVGNIYAGAASANVVGGASVGTMLGSNASQYGLDSALLQRGERENEITKRLQLENIKRNKLAAKKQRKLAIAGSVMGSLAGIGSSGESAANIKGAGDDVDLAQQPTVSIQPNGK